MRRVLRIFAAMSAGLSILVCITIVILWVRSYSKIEWWSRFPYDIQTHEYGQGWIHSGQGRTAVIFWNFKINDGMAPQMAARAAKGDFSGRWRPGHLLTTWPTPQHWWERIVFVQVDKNVNSGWGPGSGVMVIVPYWVFAAMFSIWPAIW